MTQQNTADEKTQIKMRLIAEIGKLETDIAKQETLVREWEVKVGSARNNRTGGAIALLISILGMLFLIGLWFVWVFLFLIGGLTLLTAISRQNEAERSIKEISQFVAVARGLLAEKRAALAVL